VADRKATAMAVDDLWYLTRRDPLTGKLVPSERHGRGKRWRVRNRGAGTKLFGKQSDAERYDANVRADVSRGVYVDPRGGAVLVRDQGEDWRKQQLHRDSTAERVERALRLHVYPALGHMQLAQVRSSHLRGWVKDRATVLAPSTLGVIYGGVLVPLFRAAVTDRLIGASPCVGVRLPDIEDSAYTIPTPEQVHELYGALPERYRALVYVTAGCGLRGGEAFGLELAAVDFVRREVEVRHQLAVLAGRRPFLAPPKTKSSRRTVELPEIVSTALARHLERFPARPVELGDDTDGRNPTRRAVQLLFTNATGEPIHRASWSHVWRPAVRKVGLPEGFGVRDLRHYFATVLIFGGANVKTVQLAMGHTTPMVTLNTYVGYWPDALDRTRSLVDAALSCTQSVPLAAAGGEIAGHDGRGGGT